MHNQYFLTRIMGPDPALRAADADRERAAERLRKAHAEGRLDLAEFQERLERCYEAKTFGQLTELVHDLPHENPPARRPSVGWLRPWRLAPLAPILVALIVVSAAAGHHVVWFWFLLVFVLWRFSGRRRRGFFAGPRQRSDDWI